MIATIQRLWKDATATCGVLSLDGKFECYTLEPATPIPAGSYQARISISSHLSEVFGRPFPAPEILAVPGHTGIRWHPGNRAADTQDCTLVGQTHGTDFVGHSGDEFASLMARLPATFQVVYLDPPPSQS